MMSSDVPKVWWLGKSNHVGTNYLAVALNGIRKQGPSQTHLPWEIWTSDTNLSLRGNLCGMTARSAIPLMMVSQCAANSSGRSRSRTTSDGTVRMMFSNSNSAHGEGAVRSKDQSAGVVTPRKNERMGVFRPEHWIITVSFCQEVSFKENIFTMTGFH